MNVTYQRMDHMVVGMVLVVVVMVVVGNRISL
jgi:hypothetical protein